MKLLIVTSAFILSQYALAEPICGTIKRIDITKEKDTGERVAILKFTSGGEVTIDNPGRATDISAAMAAFQSSATFCIDKSTSLYPDISLEK